jgi:hypothetical protein
MEVGPTLLKRPTLYLIYTSISQLFLVSDRIDFNCFKISNLNSSYLEWPSRKERFQEQQRKRK